jgi:hypothetical protein
MPPSSFSLKRVRKWKLAFDPESNADFILGINAYNCRFSFAFFSGINYYQPLKFRLSILRSLFTDRFYTSDISGLFLLISWLFSNPTGHFILMEIIYRIISNYRRKSDNDNFISIILYPVRQGGPSYEDNSFQREP